MEEGGGWDEGGEEGVWSSEMMGLAVIGGSGSEGCERFGRGVRVVGKRRGTDSRRGFITSVVEGGVSPSASLEEGKVSAGRLTWIMESSKRIMDDARMRSRFVVVSRGIARQIMLSM